MWVHTVKLLSRRSLPFLQSPLQGHEDTTPTIGRAAICHVLGYRKTFHGKENLKVVNMKHRNLQLRDTTFTYSVDKDQSPTMHRVGEVWEEGHSCIAGKNLHKHLANVFNI